MENLYFVLELLIERLRSRATSYLRTGTSTSYAFIVYKYCSTVRQADKYKVKTVELRVQVRVQYCSRHQKPSKRKRKIGRMNNEEKKGATLSTAQHQEFILYVRRK